MKDYRCKFCHKLLFKIFYNGRKADIDSSAKIVKDMFSYIVEVKCGKCGHITKFNKEEIFSHYK